MAATCSYCGSGVGGSDDGGKAYCGFCEMKVTPSVDGQRVERYQPAMFVDYSQVRMNTPQLMEQHTKSLLELLRFMRAERKSTYDLMSTVRQGAKIEPEKFKGDLKIAGEEYEQITKKVFVVENILRERLGYIPDRITDKMLIDYEKNCLNPNNEKLMTIRRQPEPVKEHAIEREGVTR